MGRLGVGGRFGRMGRSWRGLRIVAVMTLALLASAVVPGGRAYADTGDTIRMIHERDVLRCGINIVPGFAFQDVSGRWDGFFVDICRALAAAVLGDAERFEIISVEARSRWAALREGEADVNLDGSTWTLGRDTDMGFDFPGVYLYDGQRFLAGPSVSQGSIREVEGKSICVVTGTTTEVNLDAFLARTGLTFPVVRLNSDEGGWLSFTKGRCDIFTNDGIGLALRNANNAPNPEANHLLSDVISKEPLGPVVREDDPQWTAVVRWVLNILVAAEEQGVTQATLPGDADADRLGTDWAVLVGRGDDHAKALGLEPGWIPRVITQVGNYGEIFDRNLGANSALKLERGLNAPWTEGGLMYAPPLQ